MTRPTYIYFLYSHKWNAVKVGCSMSPKMRAISMGQVTPETLGFIGIIRSPRKHERPLQLYLHESHLCGEWFTLTPHVAETISRLVKCKRVPSDILKAGKKKDCDGRWFAMRKKRFHIEVSPLLCGLEVFSLAGR